MYGIILLIITLTTLNVQGETNPFGGNTVIGGGNNASGESLAGGIVNRTVHGADEVKADPGIDSNGREYKAANADSTGKTGTAMAIATGSALMATGVPMSMSIIPSVAAAGRILIAKAGMEFAQAGVDAASSAKNGAQNKQLRNKADDSPGSQTTTDAIKKAMNSPELDKLLSERGISSDDFKDRMARGEFQDAESVGRAIGDTNSYSPEDLAQAEGLAQGSLNNVFNEVHGEQISKSLNVNEALASNSSTGEGSDSSSFVSSGGNGGQDQKALELPRGSVTEGSRLGASRAEKMKEDALNPSIEGGRGTPGFDAKSLLANLLGKDVAEKIEKMVPGGLRLTLERMGILVPTARQHIFQTAHRNFRSFGKWRRSYRVAMKTAALR